MKSTKDKWPITYKQTQKLE